MIDVIISKCEICGKSDGYSIVVNHNQPDSYAVLDREIISVNLALVNKMLCCENPECIKACNMKAFL